MDPLAGRVPAARDLAKALKLDAGAVRCIHVEGSGCYGHNGADDVALDAALLARASGRPVRLQWMRDDEFAWEPYGSAMLARAKASLGADGRIVDWDYEVWSNTHSTRPNAPGADNNLLASWYLAEPSKPGPATNIPQPAGGGDRNAVPLYDFPNQRDRQSSDHRTCRCASRRCARSARTPMCSRSNRSWTSWRPRRARIRSRFASRI